VTLKPRNFRSHGRATVLFALLTLTEPKRLREKGGEKGPEEPAHPRVGRPLGHLPHQFVVIDAVKELLEIQVNHPGVAVGHVLLRLGHGLMGGPVRAEPVAVRREGPIPVPLEDLEHRLLAVPFTPLRGPCGPSVM